MANAIKWETAATIVGTTVLGAELNSLGIGAYSAVGTEVDNSTGLNQYGMVDVVIAAITVPAGGGYINIHMITSPGAAYGDSTTPGNETVVATFTAPAATTTAIRKTSTNLFVIPPTKVKFVLYNGLGVALAASANTVALYVCNDEIQ